MPFSLPRVLRVAFEVGAGMRFEILREGELHQGVGAHVDVYYAVGKSDVDGKGTVGESSGCAFDEHFAAVGEGGKFGVDAGGLLDEHAVVGFLARTRGHDAHT